MIFKYFLKALGREPAESADLAKKTASANPQLTEIEKQHALALLPPNFFDNLEDNPTDRLETMEARAQHAIGKIHNAFMNADDKQKRDELSKQSQLLHRYFRQEYSF